MNTKNKQSDNYNEANLKLLSIGLSHLNKTAQ